MNAFSYENIKIDKRSSQEISYQLAQSIKILLLNHKMTYQEILPSVQDMSYALNIRRSDVEKAYQLLMNEKFVSQINHDFYVNFFHFSANFFLDVIPLIQAIRQIGMEPSTKTISKKIVKIPVDFPVSPKINKDEKYIYIKRLYLGNGVPLVILDIFLPYNRFKDIDLNVGNNEGIYEYFHKKFDIRISSSDRKFKVVNIDKENAKLLNMMPQTASYQGISITYDQHKHIVDITRSWSIINYFFEMEFSKEDIEKIIKHHLFFI